MGTEFVVSNEDLAKSCVKELIGGMASHITFVVKNHQAFMSFSKRGL